MSCINRRDGSTNLLLRHAPLSSTCKCRRTYLTHLSCLLAAPSNRLWPRYPANFWLHLAQRNFVVAGINRWSTLPTTRCPPVPSMIPDCATNTISIHSPLQAQPVITGIIRSIKSHREKRSK